MNDFRQLRYFVAVARQMNFCRAAEQLHIAQPTLSHSIRQLEEELGVVLFERTSRSVKLTVAGNVFYEEALRMLEQVSYAYRATQRAARGEQGRLIIGFATSTINGSLHHRLRLYHERFQSVELVLRELLVDMLVEQLLLGALDLICSDGGFVNAFPAIGSMGLGNAQVASFGAPPFGGTCHAGS
jgi:DNA-binding transcriptional LysR family regulator